jgi:hypothetical protein
MLNKTLTKKLHGNDIRTLYLARIRCDSYAIRDAVRYAVRDVRLRLRDNSVDTLADRASRYSVAGSWGRAQVALLSRAIFQPKKPANTGNWRTIEFECIFPSENDLNAFVSDVRRNGLTNVTTVKTDGSVNADNDASGYSLRGHMPREIVFSYQKGNESSVRKMCMLLDAHKAYVNKSCGTHVHFDMRGVSEHDVTLYGDRLAKYVPILKRMLPASRRNNSYCQDTVNTLIRGDRYAFVNLRAYTKHGTLEVRGHSGTLNATKILNWIAICDAVMFTRVRATFEINTCFDLATLYKLDRALTSYMVGREAKFSDNAATEGEEYRAAA